jgi:hypothetical protein
VDLKLYTFPVLDSVVLEGSSKEGNLEEEFRGGHDPKMGLNTMKDTFPSVTVFHFFSFSF